MSVGHVILCELSGVSEWVHIMSACLRLCVSLIYSVCLFSGHIHWWDTKCVYFIIGFKMWLIMNKSVNNELNSLSTRIVYTFFIDEQII